MTDISIDGKRFTLHGTETGRIPAGPLFPRHLLPLAQRINAYAQEKGWYERPRELPEVTALFHSEVTEAFVELYKHPDPAYIYYRESDGKPEGFRFELADIIVRILDSAVYFGIAELMDQIQSMFTTSAFADFLSDPLMIKLHRIGAELSFALENYRNGQALDLIVTDENGNISDGIAYHWTRAVSMIDLMIRGQGADIYAYLLEKQDFNETRPYRHGGKRS